MHVLRASFFVVFLSISGLAAESTVAKPVEHQERNIEGWTVRVDQRLLEGEHEELGRKTLQLIGSRMIDIKTALPVGKLKQLQKVVIYVDYTHGELTSAQYHPSAAWLQKNGYDVALEKCVHIPDASIYVSAGHQRVQPWSLLHELAHAYHDQILSFENPEIALAWERIRDSGRFENVLHINGHFTRHYALTTPMEFFAEMTESYFGTNDFYPFNRAELQQSEPAIFKLLDKLWSDDTAVSEKP